MVLNVLFHGKAWGWAHQPSGASDRQAVSGLQYLSGSLPQPQGPALSAHLLREVTNTCAPLRSWLANVLITSTSLKPNLTQIQIPACHLLHEAFYGHAKRQDQAFLFCFYHISHPVPLLNNAFLFTSAPKEHNNMYWSSLPTIKQLRALAHQLCRAKCIPQHEGQQSDKRLIVGQHNCNASIYSSSERWHPFRQYLLKSFGKLVVNRGGRMV